MPVCATLASDALSMPILLVGTRVLGETNWAPISHLATLAQVVLALLAPASLLVNMVGSALAGAVPGSGEFLMQNMRAAKMVGTPPRDALVLQLVGTAVGAVALGFSYPLLRARYGIGEHGLSSPVSVKWAGFGELLARGMDALPPATPGAMAVALLAGVGLTVLERKHKAWMPSPTGIGMGMLIPGVVVVPMVLGGIAAWIWNVRAPKSDVAHRMPLASGLIAGEALVMVVIPVLVALGWMRK
jgi:uncharacterized oligopeptide transporter (OPT) family protein